jgi:hypothetical protein
MDAVMARMASGSKDLESVKYEKLDVVTVVRLRMEVATMLPHELSVVRTLDITVNAPKEGRAEMKQIDRRSSRFTYPAK